MTLVVGKTSAEEAALKNKRYCGEQGENSGLSWYQKILKNHFSCSQSGDWKLVQPEYHPTGQHTAPPLQTQPAESWQSGCRNCCRSSWDATSSLESLECLPWLLPCVDSEMLTPNWLP